METTESRLCLECSAPLDGRKDKKFCSYYCRNLYHNNLRETAEMSVRRINAILRKNRRILALLNPEGKRTLDGLSLAEKGFNFHYFTNVYRTQKGTEYVFCYDQGYLKLDNDQYMLIHRQDYVR